MTIIEESSASGKGGVSGTTAGVLVVVALVLGACFATLIGASPSGFPTVIEPGSMVGPVDFVVFKDGSTTYAKNATTGAIDYSSANSSSVIQSCLDHGRTVYLKYARYSIPYVLNVSSYRTLTGDIGTILTGAIMPILYVNGTSQYDQLEAVTRCGMEISNIDFEYTGTVRNGSFVHIRMIQTDRQYAPLFLLRNLRINSNQSSIPTLDNFTGLKLQDSIGATLEYLQISKWGKGMDIQTSLPPAGSLDAEHNYFDHVTVTYCRWGVWEHTEGGGSFYEKWERVKVMDCVKTSFTAYAYEIEFVQPDIDEMSLVYDGTYQCGINLTAGNLRISGGKITSAHDVCLRVNLARVIVENMKFGGSLLAIYAYQSFVYLVCNIYDTITTKVYTDDWKFISAEQDMYKTYNSGMATVTGANSSVVITHAVNPYPYVILVTCLNLTAGAGCGEYYISAKDATTFTISFENQPAANTWYFYWYASSTIMPVL